MAEVVNLRTVKKQAARKAARSLADASAAKHGRTKAERDLEKARAEKAAKALDAHKRDSE
jgi:Domain of unknown function (DUF4169)